MLLHPWDFPGKSIGVGYHFLLQWMKVKSLSRAWPSATPWTAAFQAPPSMGFSRQEYWSGLPLPSPTSSIRDLILFHEFTSLLKNDKLLQLCPTVCHSIGCSPPGSSVHGISQARILEWVTISCSRGSSQSSDWIWVSYISCIGRQILYHYHHLGLPLVEEVHLNNKMDNLGRDKQDINISLANPGWHFTFVF